MPDAGKMLCPRDGRALEPVRLADVELDRCPGCRGLWCDRGELERLEALDRTELEGQLAAAGAAAGDEADGDADYMRCPRCGARLLEQNYTWTAPVRVDRCRGCFGFWLDEGELDHIAAEEGKVSGGPREERALKRLFRNLSRGRGR